MRKKLVLAVLFFAVLLLAFWAFRTRGQAGWTVVSSNGAPSGSCTVFQINIDTTTGNVWTCLTGAWTMAAIPAQIPLRGTTGTITGTLLALGACNTGTATVTGATTAMQATASPVSDPGSTVMWHAWVSSANTVTVKECELVLGTPNNTAFNVTVNP